MKHKMVVFHPALVPYRIDFFNKVAAHFNARFYFTNANLINQKFDQNRLRSECHFEFNLLTNGFRVLHRFVRFGIYQTLKKEKPSIVLCSEYSQITIVVLILKFLMGKKFKVYTISDDSIDISIKRRGIRNLLRFMVSYIIDGVILPSKPVCEWYSKNVNKKTKLLTLPIIHDNNIFRKKLKNSLPIAQTYANNYQFVDTKVFLFVGRLVKIKNVGLLLNAYAKAIINNKDSVLIIIGQGEEEENLKKLANRLGIEKNCLFPGRFEGQELFAWYTLADCFVLPSYHEPYGVVVNEALLSGCTVLCSNKAGASDLINNENGCLFDPFDVHELSNQIVAIIKKIDKKNNEIGLKNDLMPFTFDTKIEKLIECLHTIEKTEIYE